MSTSPATDESTGFPKAEPRRRIPLHTKILIGLLIGGVAGIAANLLAPREMVPAEPNASGTEVSAEPGKTAPAMVERPNATLLWITKNIADPIGQVFLRL